MSADQAEEGPSSVSSRRPRQQVADGQKVAHPQGTSARDSSGRRSLKESTRIRAAAGEVKELVVDRTRLIAEADAHMSFSWTVLRWSVRALR